MDGNQTVLFNPSLSLKDGWVTMILSSRDNVQVLLTHVAKVFYVLGIGINAETCRKLVLVFMIQCVVSNFVPLQVVNFHEKC